jgi:hypothetical protein
VRRAIWAGGGVRLGRQRAAWPVPISIRAEIDHLREIQVAMGQRGRQIHQGVRLVVREGLQDGLIDQAVEGDLGGHVLDCQWHLVRFGQQDHALQRQRLYPLALVEHLAAAYPVVAPECLVDHEVAHALVQHRILDLGQALALGGRQVGHVEMVDVVRRAGELQARLREAAMDLGEGLGMPVTIEVFVREVAAGLLQQDLEAIAHEGLAWA